MSLKVIGTLLSLVAAQSIFAQDNSPYSRYGLGDMVPNTNIVNRAMGGISAAYADPLSVNFNNPASYSSFKTYVAEKSKQAVSGRVLLDVGINYDDRTLHSPNQPDKFSSSYLNFSYVQLGIPLRKNWGLSFGLRPVTRINYKVLRQELLTDPVSGMTIDSAGTEFSGSGGTFLPTIGTGFAIKNFSLGVNMGYLFGKKEYSTKRFLVNNDSTNYNSSDYTTQTSFGSIFFTAGAQYKINVSKHTAVRLGISGNVKQTITGTQDIIRQTFTRDANGSDNTQDSVYSQKGMKGKIIYPASYTTGLVIENLKEDVSGWSLGVDYVQNQWKDYRFFGASDSVQNNWQVRVGGQYRGKPGSNYFSNVAYRAGFFFGPDYLRVDGKLPQYGISLGMGLPLANYNRLSPGQYTIINVALEYSKRGNTQNVLNEDIFRLSVGLNFSDLWFSKRKYD